MLFDNDKYLFFNWAKTIKLSKWTYGLSWRIKLRKLSSTSDLAFSKFLLLLLFLFITSYLCLVSFLVFFSISHLLLYFVSAFIFSLITVLTFPRCLNLYLLLLLCIYLFFSFSLKFIIWFFFFLLIFFSKACKLFFRFFFRYLFIFVTSYSHLFFLSLFLNFFIYIPWTSYI